MDKKTRYINNINKLANNIKRNMTKGLSLQENTIDSIEYNKTYKSINEKINLLYEDIRALQEIKLFSETYIKQEIIKNSKLCKELLKQIEATRDLAKKDGYIVKNVPLRLKNEIYRDRDGIIMNKCHIIKNSIVISSEEIDNILPTNITLNNFDLKAEKNNIKEMFKKEYRSFYMLGGPVNNGLKEEIILEFDKPTDINYIHIEESNCELLEINWITPDNKTITDSYNPPIKQDKKIIAAKIMINCENYKEKTYQIDETRVDKNYWNKVKDETYLQLQENTINNESSIDTGIKKYREDYNKYIQDLESWKKEKNRIYNINNAIRKEYEEKEKNTLIN